MSNEWNALAQAAGMMMKKEFEQMKKERKLELTPRAGVSAAKWNRLLSAERAARKRWTKTPNGSTAERIAKLDYDAAAAERRAASKFCGE